MLELYIIGKCGILYLNFYILLTEGDYMKLAIFTDTFSPQINGVTRTLDRLVMYLERYNIEYRIFAPAANNYKYDENKKEIIRLPGLDFFLYPELKIALPNYFKIKQELDQFEPDLIHIITPFNIGLCGLKYGKDNSIRTVSSYHTNFDSYLDYYNFNFIENLYWKYLNWFHQLCEINYCPSRETRKQLKKRGITNLQIWGRGIDVNQFSPEYYSEKLKENYGLQDKIVLLYVGRLAREKNLKLLFDSLKMLNRYYKKKKLKSLGLLD